MLLLLLQHHCWVIWMLIPGMWCPRITLKPFKEGKWEAPWKKNPFHSPLKLRATMVTSMRELETANKEGRGFSAGFQPN